MVLQQGSAAGWGGNGRFCIRTSEGTHCFPSPPTYRTPAALARIWTELRDLTHEQFKSCNSVSWEGARKGDDTGPYEHTFSGLPLSAHLHQLSKAFSTLLHLIGLGFTLLACQTETRATKHGDMGLEPSPELPGRSLFSRPNSCGLLAWDSETRDRS